MIRDLEGFIRESNRIEGILREPTKFEIMAHEDLIYGDPPTILALVQFVNVVQPGARLRDKEGLDVTVGNHVPPRGGAHVRQQLEVLLKFINSGRLGPQAAHLNYETLHPFTDGNGRSGRAIWAWQMVRRGDDIPLGFLHTFYYQTLAASR